MLYLDILCFLGSVHKGCSIFFLSFFEIFTYQPLSYFELHTQIFPCIDHCGSALNDVLAVNLRLQAQKCAFQRTIGQNCKNPPKNQKKIVKLTLSYYYSNNQMQ